MSYWSREVIDTMVGAIILRAVTRRGTYGKELILVRLGAPEIICTKVFVARIENLLLT
jgi:hypothetical protein